MKSKNIGRILNLSQTDSRTTRWRFLVTQCLNSHSFYNLLWEDSLAGIQVLVFASSEIVDHIKNVSCLKTKMGIMGLANKGSVTVSLTIHETPVKFAVCHLNAGCEESDSESRVEQINTLLQGDFVREVDSQLTQNNGYRFLLGDLNFRLNLDNESVQLILQDLKKCTNLAEKKRRINQLLDNDQLYDQIRKNKLLMTFTEADINFNPTYKMEPMADEYKIKKGRTPSW